MNDSVTQALAQLNLQPGQCQRYEVNGRQIEVRCIAAEEKSEFADMGMLVPWVDFPSPGPTIKIVARPGKLPLPDPPVIPDDWEEAGT